MKVEHGDRISLLGIHHDKQPQRLVVLSPFPSPPCGCGWQAAGGLFVKYGSSDMTWSSIQTRCHQGDQIAVGTDRRGQLARRWLNQGALSLYAESKKSQRRQQQAQRRRSHNGQRQPPVGRHRARQSGWSNPLVIVRCRSAGGLAGGGGLRRPGQKET